METHKGYDNPTGEAAVEKHHYTGHIRRIGEEKVSQGKKVSGDLLESPFVECIV